MSQMYLGQIVMFGGNFAIQGYLFCSGQLLAISQNQALFSLLGTTYGGDGRTSYGLPDIRGRTPVHAGQGSGLQPRPLGARFGVETVTLNQATMPQHSHGASFTPSGGGNITVQNQNGNQDAPTSESYIGLPRAQSPVRLYTNATGAEVQIKGGSASGGDVSVQPTGQSQPFQSVGPRLSVNFEIVVQGLYPSRN